MANSVFENALSTVAQSLAAVEAEIGRMSGVYQQTEALRVQQRDLQKTNNDLATKVAESRLWAAEAAAEAKSIIGRAQYQQKQIIDNAEKQADMIVKAANSNADDIIANVNDDISSERAKLDELQEQVGTAEAKLATINRNISLAKERFAELKRQHIAAMAVLE